MRVLDICPRSVPRRAAALLVALAVTAAAVPAAAKGSSDPRAERRRVQQERAAKAAEVNTLRATDAEVTRALDQIDANFRAQEAAAVAARQSADVALQTAERARADAARAEQEFTKAAQTVRDVAVASYMEGPSHSLALTLDAKSIGEATTRRELLDVAVNRGRTAADQLRAARDDLARERAASEQAAREATARRAAAEQRLRSVSAARKLKQQLADSVEQRLERSLAEAASLATVDKRLADEIAAREQALARRAGPGRARGGVTRASRGGSRGSVNTTVVRGIEVATSIASQLDSMLAKAERDGLVFGGGGYRSSDQQVAARRANCGTSDYDVYEKPASQCSPPTARPGQSMHEQGLAIDFTLNGRIISRSSPGFQWLRGNAADFGFYNLPSESWHWSTNGN